MFAFLKQKWGNLFSSNAPHHISSSSTLASVEKLYPHLSDFLFTRYKIQLTEAAKRTSLTDFVKQNTLPPAQILFMELQMQERIKNVKILSAKEAKELLLNLPNTVVFDTRDPHEWQHHGRLKQAKFLEDSNFLEEIKTLSETDTILCYCHFGVRSLNYAAQLCDLGFKNVHVIRGGIDEWSTEVEPTLPRYQGDYC